MSFLMAAAIVVGVGLGPARARAEQEARSFSLNVVREGGAESCISSQRLASMVQQWVGPVFVAAAESELAVEALLRRDGRRGWRATVTVSDARGAVLGTRELRVVDPQCRALERSLVLVVVLAIDPELAARGLPAELATAFAGDEDPARELLRELQSEARTRPAAPRTEASADAGVVAASPDRRIAAAPKPPDRGWRWELAAGLGSGFGQLPKLATGPALALEVEPPGFWPLRVSTGLWLENDAELPSPTARGDAIHFSMLQWGAQVCPTLWRAQSFRVRACGGVLLLFRSADSGVLDAGVDADQFSVVPLLGPEFGLALADGWWLTAAATAQPALGRDTYTYADQFGDRHELFRPATVAVGAELGLSLRL